MCHLSFIVVHIDSVNLLLSLEGAYAVCCSQLGVELAAGVGLLPCTCAATACSDLWSELGRCFGTWGVKPVACGLVRVVLGSLYLG